MSKAALRRFLESMKLDYEKWHDGIGYDLDALDELDPEEIDYVECLISNKQEGDWRDVEAVNHIASPRRTVLLRKLAQNQDRTTRLHAAELLLAQDEEALVRPVIEEALANASIGDGLTTLLEIVQTYRRPWMIAAVQRGCLEQDGATAVHFAAMLCYLSGVAKEPFDWDHRPLFLRFNTPDKAERRKALEDLCARTGYVMP